MERAWRNIACLIPMMSGFVTFFFSNMERAWRNTTCLIPISLTLWRMLSWSQTNALEPFQLY